MKIKLKKNILFVLITACCYTQGILGAPLKDSIPNEYKMKPIHMQTRWAKEVSPLNALKEYPRPQLQRDNWLNLNGIWDYAITDSSTTRPAYFEGHILVPYPIESALSGVKRSLLPEKRLWYRKKIQCPSSSRNERIIIHFGAIDWQSTVFINNIEVGQHTGGYQNFSYDITDFLTSDTNEILIKVYDPSDQGPNPHGKQVLDPGNIYYTPSSGIWQTVWLEKVPKNHIVQIKSTPNIDNSRLNITINTSTSQTENMLLEVCASTGGKIISTRKKQIAVYTGDENSRLTNISLNIPNEILWSPDNPFLYDLSVKLLKGGKTIDEIKSYFGMRKISIQKDEKGADRIFLNNNYTYNLGTLDQGFWPEGLYTAPTDEALSFDIKTIKSLGFNTIRKHIKVEPDRWYYHADKIGILVWQDFVNPPQDLPEGSKLIFEREVQKTIDQLYNHPSIVTWVLFNEGWGAYDQPRLTKWIKTYDSTRIVNGHSGELLYVDDQLRAPAISPWLNSDLADVHSYPNPRIPPASSNKAGVVGEFGGVGVSVFGHEWDDIQGWGYIQVTPSELRGRYKQMMENLKRLEALGLSGSIYTQPFDVEGEENGLLTYDREVIKIPVNEIRSINESFVKQTDAFKLDAEFNIAKNINTDDNDNRYDELLIQYGSGLRDSIFLRRLTLMAIRKKDQKNATKIGNDYIGIMKDPYSGENLIFIRSITRTSKDRGFQLFFQQPDKIDSILGEKIALRKVKKIIDTEEISPYTSTKGEIPDWTAIQQKIINMYGSIGEELVLGKRMVYYGFQSKDWVNFGKYYVLYFEKAVKNPDYYINNVTWELYLHVEDQNVLEFAVGVMKYAIEKWDKSAEAYDTYANLLHRTNKSQEAIEWEEKALQLKKGAPEEKILSETLQKMKSGQPTWPTNN